MILRYKMKNLCEYFEPVPQKKIKDFKSVVKNQPYNLLSSIDLGGLSTAVLGIGAVLVGNLTTIENPENKNVIDELLIKTLYTGAGISALTYILSTARDFYQAHRNKKD